MTKPCTINMKPGWVCTREEHEEGPCALVEMPDFSEIGKQRETATSVGDQDLFCYGCAHSIGGAKFPSGPSGERPCFFCVRNPDREQWQKDRVADGAPELKQWYDGSPIAFYPMDAYMTIDGLEQQRRWSKRDKGIKDWNQPDGGIRFG
jgi:hypothetical protein